MSQNKAKFLKEIGALIPESKLSEAGVTLEAINTALENAGDERENVLRSLRKSAAYGRAIAEAQQVVLYSGIPFVDSQNERIIHFPVTYPPSVAERLWTQWALGACSISDKAVLIEPRYIEQWQGMSWFDACEALGSVVPAWKCVGFNPRTTTNGSTVVENLPPFCFDPSKVKQIFSSDPNSFMLYSMEWDDFTNPKEELKELGFVGRQGRKKRGALIESIRANHDYGEYVDELYLEPKSGNSKKRRLNKRGLSYVQGELLIDPYFTQAQLEKVNS